MSNYTFSCFVNVSDSSVTDHGWIVRHPNDLDFDTTGNGYAVSAILLLLFLTSVPWNSLVIGVILYKKKLRSQPTVLLMLNLSITNLLLALLIMPFNIVSGIKGEYVFGETDLVRCRVCQIGIAVVTLPWISIHTLCLMAIDRFIYLKWPLKYKTVVTSKRVVAIIIAVWILCIALSIPPLVGFGEIKFSYTVASCVIILVGSTHIAPNYYYAMMMLVEILVPVVTLFVLYVWVMCIIRSSLMIKLTVSTTKKQKQQKNNFKVASKTTIHQQRKAQLRLVQLFGAIFTANLVTWLPMIVLALMGAILGSMRIPTLMFSIAYLSFLSETLIHPILEVSLIRDIRLALCELTTFLRKRICICCPAEPCHENTNSRVRSSHDRHGQHTSEVKFESHVDEVKLESHVDEVKLESHVDGQNNGHVVLNIEPRSVA